MSKLRDLRLDLKSLADPKKAKLLQRFFKTGKGQYGEGDIFLGITVPNSRKIAIVYKDLSFSEVRKLLQSKIHEERLIALLIIVHNFAKGTDEVRRKIFKFYLLHTKYINNWDLVDLSAPKIAGEYLYQKYKSETNSNGKNPNDQNVLERLARSENLWERRIAMVATYQFIINGSSRQTLAIAKILLHDKHDLVQKAVGWMLREVGKRCSQEVEEEFLKKYYKQMGRTALRYAIEHFSAEKRARYLSGTI